MKKGSFILKYPLEAYERALGDAGEEGLLSGEVDARMTRSLKRYTRAEFIVKDLRILVLEGFVVKQNGSNGARYVLANNGGSMK